MPCPLPTLCANSGCGILLWNKQMVYLKHENIKIIFLSALSGRTWCPCASSPTVGSPRQLSLSVGRSALHPIALLPAPQSRGPAPDTWRVAPRCRGGAWHCDATPVWELPAGRGVPLAKTKPGGVCCCRRTKAPLSCNLGRPRAASAPSSQAGGRARILPGAALALGRGCSRPGGRGEREGSPSAFLRDSHSAGKYFHFHAGARVEVGKVKEPCY